MKVRKTLLFMLRHPIPLIVHLTCWFLLAAWGIVADDPFIEGTWPPHCSNYDTACVCGRFSKSRLNYWRRNYKRFKEKWILGSCCYAAFLYLLPTEAIGNLKGTAKEHQIWMAWYRRQQETIAAGDDFVESSPPLKNMRVNSYFRKAQKTLLFLIRRPKPLLIHFLYWIPAYFLLILTTEFPDLADMVRTTGSFVRNFPLTLAYLAIVAAIFSLISSYQETRGTVKGIAKVQQAWAEWYRRQQEAKAQGTLFDAPPPSFNTF